MKLRVISSGSYWQAWERPGEGLGWGAAVGLGGCLPPYLGRIEDLLDLQDVGDVPRVLGEGAQGEGVLADKSCGEGKGCEGVVVLFLPFLLPFPFFPSLQLSASAGRQPWLPSAWLCPCL